MPEQAIIKDVDKWGIRFRVNDAINEETMRTVAARQIAGNARKAQMLLIDEPKVWFDTDRMTDVKWCYATVRVIANHDHDWQAVSTDEPLKCSICGKERWPDEIVDWD